jgi:hypothetical protein
MRAQLTNILKSNLSRKFLRDLCVNFRSFPLSNLVECNSILVNTFGNKVLNYYFHREHICPLYLPR